MLGPRMNRSQPGKAQSLYQPLDERGCIKSEKPRVTKYDTCPDAGEGR